MAREHRTHVHGVEIRMDHCGGADVHDLNGELIQSDFENLALAIAFARALREGKIRPPTKEQHQQKPELPKPRVSTGKGRK